MFYELSATDKVLNLEPEELELEPQADNAIDKKALAGDDNDEGIPPLSVNKYEDKESEADDENEESTADEAIPVAAATYSGQKITAKYQID